MFCRSWIALIFIPAVVGVPSDFAGPATSPVVATSVTKFDLRMFADPPSNCTAWLYGDPGGQTWWHGCPTFSCNPAPNADPDDPPPVCDSRWTAWDTRYCACSDGGAAAYCYAEIGFTSGGQPNSVNCYPNGCGQECSLWLWWPDTFSPCNC